MKRKRVLFVGLILFVLSIRAVSAQVQPTSHLIPFSGSIPGQPDGSVAVRFRLFPGPTGGAFCFEETQTVTVVGEVFSVFIGDGTSGGIPADPCFTANLSSWIAFALNPTPETEIGDRTPITAAGFALRAITAESADIAQTLTPGAVISGSLADPSLTAANNGAGSAGLFQINNAANSNPALQATTNGTGNAISGQTTGTGNAMVGTTTGSGNGVAGRTTGTGRAGSFEIDNTANANAALQATTNGSGKAVFGKNTGTGGAGFFQIDNAANISPALQAITNGAGNALFGQTTGLGDAVLGQTSGAGRAGLYQISNAANASPALEARTNGPGNALFGQTTGAGDAVFGRTTGAGRAGFFQIANATNASPALEATTNGTGDAVVGITGAAGTGRGGVFGILNAANASDALRATTNGIGRAGFFQIANPANASAALEATTNGANATAAAVRAIGNGVANPITGPPQAAALEIRNGAIRVSGANQPAGKVDFGATWGGLCSRPLRHRHWRAVTSMEWAGASR